MAESKHGRRAIRKLANTAYERELSQALSELEDQFKAWRAGSIDCFELNDRIHKHHDGISRDLWGRYTNVEPGQILPSLIARGIIQESEVPAEILARFHQSIDFLKRSHADDETEDSEEED